jgi:flagellar hook-basal body complex protein FliE
MSEIDMNSVLLQMRAMAARAQGVGTEATGGSEAGGFSTLLKDALSQVNETQQKAVNLATAFETGSNDADIAEVMMAVQKASLSFQAVTQVRNKLVSAYQDIMNMQV